LTSSPPPPINDVHGHNSGGMVEDLKNGVVRVTLPSDHPMNGTGAEVVRQFISTNGHVYERVGTENKQIHEGLKYFGNPLCVGFSEGLVDVITEQLTEV